MDRGRIVNTLGLISGGIFTVIDLQIINWGKDIVFTCDYRTYQPDGTPDAPVTFHLRFEDCRELRLRTYAHIAEAEMGEIGNVAEMAEIALGLGGHRRDANLLTTHFAVTLSYGMIVLEHEGVQYPLP